MSLQIFYVINSLIQKKWLKLRSLSKLLQLRLLSLNLSLEGGQKVSCIKKYFNVKKRKKTEITFYGT